MNKEEIKFKYLEETNGSISLDKDLILLEIAYQLKMINHHLSGVDCTLENINREGLGGK